MELDIRKTDRRTVIMTIIIFALPEWKKAEEYCVLQSVLGTWFIKENSQEPMLQIT